MHTLCTARPPCRNTLILYLTLLGACAPEESPSKADGSAPSEGEGEGNTFYRDADGDSWGTDTDTARGSTAPEGYVRHARDCDDTNAAINPDATEIPYDGVDQNCESEDEYDADGDGYDHAGYGGDDCDDDDSTIYPGAPEDADGVDSDCDGVLTTHEGDTLAWALFVDADGDGYGDHTVVWYSVLSRTPVAGYVDNRWDCDDANATVNALAVEDCDDGLDNDCDGLLDCEDDACASDSACVEIDCADGADGDGDGDRDCADEDCWGTTACAVVSEVTAWVRSGEYRVVRDNRAGSRTCGHFAASTGVDRTITASSDYEHLVVHASVASLSGTAVVKGADGTSTCSWGFSHANFLRRFSVSTMSGEALESVPEDSSSRSGFWVGGDCGLASSAFLPHVSDDAVTFFDLGASGWYRGGRWHETGSGTRTSDWEVDPRGEGVDWSCSHPWANTNLTQTGTLVTGEPFTTTLPLP